MNEVTLIGPTGRRMKYDVIDNRIMTRKGNVHPWYGVRVQQTEKTGFCGIIKVGRGTVDVRTNILGITAREFADVISTITLNGVRASFDCAAEFKRKTFEIWTDNGVFWMKDGMIRRGMAGNRQVDYRLNQSTGGVRALTGPVYI